MRDMDPTFGDLRELRAKMMVWAARYASGADREDLVQATLLRMLAYRHTAPRNPDEIAPWTQFVMRSVFLYQRKRRAVPCTTLDDVLLAAPDNPETSTYCRQVFRMCLGLDPSLLLDPDSNGQRWITGVAKTVTERRKRYRARLALQQVAA